MRAYCLAKWVKFPQGQAPNPARRVSSPPQIWIAIVYFGLAVMLGAAPPAQGEANAALDAGSLAGQGDLEPTLVGASLPQGKALPFSSEAELLDQLGQDFAPIQELFLNIAVAQVCGLRTKQVEAEYLARRAQLAQNEALDFDTLKALRYLSYVQLERRLRAVEPTRLRPWCEEQQPELRAFFQPQL